MLPAGIQIFVIALDCRSDFYYVDLVRRSISLAEGTSALQRLNSEDC